MDKPLEGIRVLDMTHRLPGPLAGGLLASLGAEVIKIEDGGFKDPFVHGLFADIDESFPAVYERLNHRKRIVRLDFKSPTAAADIGNLVAGVDCLLMGLPPKVRRGLGIDRRAIESLGRPLAVVEPASSAVHPKFMHDINALAETGLLKLHVQGESRDVLAPPFMPTAGIALGAKMATDILACLLKARRIGEAVFMTTHLVEATEEIFSPFWPETMRGTHRFLHNGLYPCYSLYRTSDGSYVALAAVEEKLWLRFCEVFDLDIAAPERFEHTDGSVFAKLSEKFKTLSAKEIAKLVRDENFCLSLI